MFSLNTLFSGIKTVESLLNSVLSKRGTKIEKKIIAVTKMRKAINITEAYLVKSSYDYKPNEDLSNLWLDAFSAMTPINKSLAKQLNDNSRFWSNPQKWLEEESAMELIPSLKEIDEKCEMYLQALSKRQ